MADEVGPPYELLELQDGQSVSFRAIGHARGELVITPQHAPQGKRVPVLRVHVPVTDKPSFPHYWDLTSNRLIPQLLPHLTRADVARLRFTVTARGIPPKRYFTLEVAPT